MKRINILIIGGGRRGYALINALSQSQDFNIVGVVDINENAKGIRLARQLGIETAKDYKKFISKDIDVILNLSGDMELQEVLKLTKPKNAELLSEYSTKLLWHVLYEAERSYLHIQKKVSELDLILNSLVEGVVVVSENKEVVLINPSAKQMLGWNETKRITQDDLLYPLIERVFSDENLSVISCETYTKEEFDRPIVLRAQASKIKEQDFSAAVVVLRDVTKEKEVEKMKEEILSNVSHELRTPLASITNAVYLLVNKIPGYVNPQQEKLLLIIQRNTQRLMSIINNLLDLSKIEGGSLDFKFQLVDLKQTIQEVVLSLKTLAEAKELDIKIQIEENLPLTYASKEGLEHILVNLVNNAIKFTPAKGKITISAKQKDKDYILFCVEDTGIGIPKESFDKIFEKFYQLDNRLSPKSEGTGVGLTIVKSFVNFHRGQIWIESEVNKGSKFYFTIPSNFKFLLNNISDKIKECEQKNTSFCVFAKKINENIKEKLNLLEDRLSENDILIFLPQESMLFIIFKECDEKIISIKLENLREYIAGGKILIFKKDFSDLNDFVHKCFKEAS